MYGCIYCELLHCVQFLHIVGSVKGFINKIKRKLEISDSNQ